MAKKRPDVAKRNRLLKTKGGVPKRFQFRFDSEKTAAVFREIFLDVVIAEKDIERLLEAEIFD